MMMINAIVSVFDLLALAVDLIALSALTMVLLVMLLQVASPPCPHGYEDWDECPVCRH